MMMKNRFLISRASALAQEETTKKRGR